MARNQALLTAFFSSATLLLAPGGEVHVALKTGAPYDAWNPVGCAHHATGGSLQLKTSADFDSDAFPGVPMDCLVTSSSLSVLADVGTSI